MINDDKITELVDALNVCQSFKFGTYTLSSGKSSSYYLDLRLIQSYPEYYKIIEAFKKITGVGALLNTSLNLHGLPVVENIRDAFKVFENSDLDILILENTMIKKN